MALAANTSNMFGLAMEGLNSLVVVIEECREPKIAEVIGPLTNAHLFARWPSFRRFVPRVLGREVKGDRPDLALSVNRLQSFPVAPRIAGDLQL